MKQCVLMLMLSLLVLPFATTAAAGELDGISYMTEEFPPLNFEKDGKITGIAVDLLDAVLKKAGASGSAADVQLLPWANGYKKVQEVPDTCLFSMTRTEARENMFKWAGPIIVSRIAVIAKKGSNVVIGSPADLSKYTYGVIREDVGMQMLQAAGVPESNLDITSNNDANIKKLDAGRINAWAYVEATAMALLKQAGLNPSDFETVYVLQESPLCYAFNKNTADSKVEAFQKALDAVKAEGEADRIIERYVK